MTLEEIQLSGLIFVAEHDGKTIVGSYFSDDLTTDNWII